MHDLVIRGGTIVDGSGDAAREGDLAIDGATISEVGAVSGGGRREIDAKGQLVAPGWVDVHTHYDGQVTWDPQLSPSCWHGVTTAVMGNCGVGFAPVRADEREYLIHLMEGVEDIPGTALYEGIQWEWESFPEYLDALDRRHFALDIGAQLPHAALRFYVMGERGAEHTEVPTQEEIVEMARLAREAVSAGALGFTTSRTRNHRSSDGRHTPSLTAELQELVGIAKGLGEAGAGVFEIVSDFVDVPAEFEMMREMVETSGRPMSISLAQNQFRPDEWREVMHLITQACDAGLSMAAQVPARGIGLLLGLQASMNPFVSHPSYKALAELPLAERIARLRDPGVREKILAEEAAPGVAFIVADWQRMYELGDPPDYEPGPERSIAALAQAQAREPAAVAYDLLLERDGTALLYRPLLNYVDGDLEVARQLLSHPHAVPGLGDAGAHCGLICDGSFPTYHLSHWGKDRTRGERLPMEWLVKRQSADTAALVGLHDRGRLEPGMKADVNVIDFAALGLRAPEIVFDLPAGGKRLMQRANGYRATLVSGEVTLEDGEATGALPGKLVRGAQSAPR